LQVTDVADAVILTTLFDTLFSSGVVVVATSNREIDSLYEGGVNEEYFKGTRELIKNYCMEVKIQEDTDFRVGRGGGVGGEGEGDWVSERGGLEEVGELEEMGEVEVRSF